MFLLLRIVCSTALFEAVSGAATGERFPMLRPPYLRNARDITTAFTSGIINTGNSAGTVSAKAVSSNASNGNSSGTCILTNQYCALQGSEHALDGLRDVCVLWDNSCTGPKTAAEDEVIGDFLASTLGWNECFIAPTPECTTSNPPGRMAAFSSLKDYMRGSECSSLQLASIDAHNPPGQRQDERSCCETCLVSADRVDILYWLDPKADTSCLSIINNGDILDGASTSANESPIPDLTYFDCTSFYSHTSTVIVLADLMTTGTVTYRYPINNPWTVGCANSTTSSRPSFSNTSEVSTSGTTNLHAMTLAERGVTTLVSDGYTL